MVIHWKPVIVLFVTVASSIAVMASANVLPPPAPAQPAPAPTSAAIVHRSPPGGYAQPSRPLLAEPPGRHLTLYAESFANDATTPSAWESGDDACLTAGTSETPPTSVPACGANAPQDPNGSGALQLMPPSEYVDGFVFLNMPLHTNRGLSVTFNFYSFDGGGEAGDGLALVLTDGRKVLPSEPGGCCGSLDYAPYVNRGLNEYGLRNGYIAVALDESGVFSQDNEGRTGGIGGTGSITNLLAARGSVQTHDQYLLSTVNAQGKPASLPFPLAFPASQTRPAPLTVNITLTRAAVLTVSIDRNDGNGPKLWIHPTEIVGLIGQPILPTQVYLGFTAAAGQIQSRHQINDFVVTTTQ